jgi:hypothetical protein
MQVSASLRITYHCLEDFTTAMRRCVAQYGLLAAFSQPQKPINGCPIGQRQCSLSTSTITTGTVPSSGDHTLTGNLAGGFGAARRDLSRLRGKGRTFSAEGSHCATAGRPAGIPPWGPPIFTLIRCARPIIALRVRPGSRAIIILTDRVGRNLRKIISSAGFQDGPLAAGIGNYIQT